MTWFEDKGNAIIINIRAVPRSAQNSIQGLHGDALKVRIQAPPIDGKANAFLVKFLSRHWKIPRSTITILSGETGRNKRLQISPASAELRKELLSIASG
jgi:uncharacterized protein (TIGR00251 family)